MDDLYAVGWRMPGRPRQWVLAVYPSVTAAAAAAGSADFFAMFIPARGEPWPASTVRWPSLGSIPARAGNPSAIRRFAMGPSPHARGTRRTPETAAGPSPHARGTQRREPADRARQRSIPARAGNPLGVRPSACCRQGPSPRVRGWTLAQSRIAPGPTSPPAPERRERGGSPRPPLRPPHGPTVKRSSGGRDPAAQAILANPPDARGGRGQVDLDEMSPFGGRDTARNSRLSRTHRGPAPPGTGPRQTKPKRRSVLDCVSTLGHYRPRASLQPVEMSRQGLDHPLREDRHAQSARSRGSVFKPRHQFYRIVAHI